MAEAAASLRLTAAAAAAAAACCARVNRLPSAPPAMMTFVSSPSEGSTMGARPRPPPPPPQLVCLAFGVDVSIRIRIVIVIIISFSRFFRSFCGSAARTCAAVVAIFIIITAGIVTIVVRAVLVAIC